MTTETTTDLKPTIFVTAAPLRAALHCAANNKEPRTYLQGIRIKFKDAPAGVKATVAGCDGHILFIALSDIDFLSDESAPTQWANTSIIVPLDVVKKIGKKAHQLPLEQLGANVYKLGDIVFEPLDGQYPDIARVIPDRTALDACEVKPAIYNPDLLIRARKALTEHYGVKTGAVFQLAQYGDNCGIMHAGENSAQVVVMPMRANGAEGSETVYAFNRDYL